MTVGSCGSGSPFLAPRSRKVLSLQVVRNWLALSDPSKYTMSSDSKMGGVLCLIEISQYLYVRVAGRDYHNSLQVLRVSALGEEECIESKV